MKINHQNNNLVSSLRERFENKILSNESSKCNNNQIFSKYRHHSPLPSSSSSSSSSPTPPPPPTLIKQEEEEEEEDAIQPTVDTSIPSKQENESNETNLMNYYRNLTNMTMKSNNEILFSNFVNKFQNLGGEELKKMIYLKLIKTNEDGGNSYKFTIDYSDSILSLICDKNVIIEQIRATEVAVDDLNSQEDNNDLLIELKTKYLFELNKIIDNKLANFISKENSVNRKIENNRQIANKVKKNKKILNFLIKMSLK